MSYGQRRVGGFLAWFAVICPLGIYPINNIVMAGMWTTLTGPPVKPKNLVKLGRPRKYSPDDLFSLAKEYFEECNSIIVRIDREGNKIRKPKTIGWFCMSLQVGRGYLIDSLSSPEYKDVVDLIKTHIENDIEIGMLTGLLNPAAGIFHLKNHFGQAEKMETKGEVDNNITISFKT